MRPHAQAHTQPPIMVDEIMEVKPCGNRTIQSDQPTVTKPITQIYWIARLIDVSISHRRQCFFFTIAESTGEQFKAIKTWYHRQRLQIECNLTERTKKKWQPAPVCECGVRICPPKCYKNQIAIRKLANSTAGENLFQQSLRPALNRSNDIANVQRVFVHNLKMFCDLNPFHTAARFCAFDQFCMAQKR